jgi:hypothetical protein
VVLVKIGNPGGVVYSKIKYPRLATVSPTSGYNRKRLRRFDSHDSRDGLDFRDSHQMSQVVVFNGNAVPQTGNSEVKADMVGMAGWWDVILTRVHKCIYDPIMN